MFSNTLEAMASTPPLTCVFVSEARALFVTQRNMICRAITHYDLLLVPDRRIW